MISLSVNNLKKTYGIDLIFQDVSFTVEENEKVGIVGSNGAGKTTFFNIITGKEGKDSGDIFVAKDKKIGYMSQNVNITSDKTLLQETLEVFSDLIALEKEIAQLAQDIADNHEDIEKSTKIMKLYEKKTKEFTDNDGYSYMSRAKGMLKGLGFSDEEFDKNVTLFSGGEKSRLLLAKILLIKPDILLLDEPTNHLDMDSVSFLETFLKNLNSTVIIISHDRYFLNTLTTKTIEFSNHTATTYNVSYEKYVAEKEKNTELEQKNYELNQRELKRQEEIIEKLKSFNREKQVKRANSRQKALDKMQRIDKPEHLQKKSKIIFETSVKSGKDVLHAENLSKSFDDKTLFENVSFDIYSGEKIALIGANGAGKTTLFNILLGEETNYDGKITYGANVNPSYFNQERNDLNEDLDIFTEIHDTFPYLTQTQVRNYLGGFLFYGDDVFKQISSLSGGEKSRISLLKLMLSKANFLFLDEPTNHLDIPSKEVLEDALNAYEGTAFIISHDRYLLNKLPDRIFELKDGTITQYLGNYDYMMEKKKEDEDLKNYLEETSKVVITKTQQKEERKKQKESQKALQALKRQEKKITSDIADMEEKIKEYDLELCKEEVYTDGEKVAQIAKDKSQIQEELKKLYKNWEELLEQIEEKEES